MNTKENHVETVSNLYRLYMRNCHIAEAAGGALLLLSILLNEFAGDAAQGAVFPLALVGGLLLLFGGSSAMPHNQIKAFARQLQISTNPAFAEGLLDALSRNRTVSVTRRTHTLVGNAILSYSSSPDADPDLVQKLDAAAAEHLKISMI